VVKRAKNLRKEADKNTWAKLTLRKKKKELVTLHGKKKEQNNCQMTMG
jgi:hypothetical protein